MSDDQSKKPVDNVALAMMLANITSAYTIGRLHGTDQASQITIASRSMEMAAITLGKLYESLMTVLCDSDWLMKTIAPMMLALISSKNQEESFNIAEDIDHVFMQKMKEPINTELVDKIMQSLNKDPFRAPTPAPTPAPVPASVEVTPTPKKYDIN